MGFWITATAAAVNAAFGIRRRSINDQAAIALGVMILQIRTATA